MSQSLDDVLEEAGLSKDAIDQVVDGFDEDVAEILASGGDVGAFVQRRAPSLPVAQQNALANGLVSMSDGVHRAFASAAAVYAHNAAQRPNASVTLFATAAGVVCTGTTIYNLRPRQAGALLADDFVFDSDMVLERLIVNPADISLKFVLVGNSTGYENDKMYSFRYDTSIVIGSTELRVEETPWASIMKRRPKEKVKFLAKVYYDNVISEEAIFGGLTLTYNEKACGAFMRLWKSAEDGIGFGDLTQMIMQRVAQRTRPRTLNVARRVAPGLLNLNSRIR